MPIYSPKRTRSGGDLLRKVGEYLSEMNAAFEAVSFTSEQGGSIYDLASDLYEGPFGESLSELQEYLSNVFETYLASELEEPEY